MAIMLETTFEELFADSNESVRRRNWVTWKRIAKGYGCAEDVDRWEKPEPCESCAHTVEDWIGAEGAVRDWCSLIGLPCSVNPVLSFRHGIPGLACCGTRLEPRQEELALFAPARSV